MGFYARPSWRLARQVASDLFVLAWGVVWWVVSRFVHDVIWALADPSRALSDTTGKLRDQLRKAAEDTGRIPAIGGELRKPFDASAASLADIARQATDQVHALENTATLAGWLVFLIPVAIVLAFWLPQRIRFFNNQREAQRFIDSSADLDLFALRAMANQPMARLAQVSADPVSAWRAGDRRVIEQLAELELASAGLRYRPRAASGAGASLASRPEQPQLPGRE